MKIWSLSVNDTQMISRYTWSGDLRSCCRTLELELLCTATDSYLPKVDMELGDRVLFSGATKQLFVGTVVTITVATGAGTKTVRCFDGGFLMNRNEAYYKFTATTPEAIVRRLSADYGIPLGDIAATGYQMSRNYLGDSLYKIAATGYTLAAAQTGEAYHIGFDLEKLTVRKKQPGSQTLIIQGGSNLISASTTESIEKLVNRVRIVDKDQKLIATEEDAKSIQLYGLAQQVISQSDDSGKQAKKVLADNGPTQKISIECLGDESCITGGTVVVHDTFTGLWGLFWIESDTHVWAKGLYTNKLVLNFKRLMDEQEVGSLPK